MTIEATVSLTETELFEILSKYLSLQNIGENLDIKSLEPDPQFEKLYHIKLISTE